MRKTHTSDVTRREMLRLAAGTVAAAATAAAWAAPEPIDEEGFVRIGGIEQWIGIRGLHC